MRLRIVGKHMELSDSLRDFAQEKLDRLEKHFDRVTQAQLILSPEFNAKRGAGTTEAAADVAEPPEPMERSEDAAEASGHCASAELILNVPGGGPLVARARGENYRAAIDMVLDKMERQVAKSRDKLRDRRQARGPS